MKQSLFIAFSALLIVFSCSLKHSAEYLETARAVPMITKASITGDDISEYSLTETDIQNYVLFRELENKKLSLVGIEPIVFKDIPCLYAIQYNDGFDIISADKRSPVPIATCDIGFFDECNDPEGFGGHLETIAEQVWFSLHGYMGKPSPEAAENIESSLNFWRLVNADSTLIAENAIETRVDPPGPDPGHWELIDVRTEEILYDSLPHLTTTTWYQNSIYNYFCPDDIDDDGDTVVCPAGCVAIAGAQMLYFLHNKIGVPTASPSSGLCVGHVYDSTYYQAFWNFSSNTWTNMRPRYNRDTCAALLVGDVGRLLHMDYSWKGSGAYTPDLIDSVFYPYGINSTLFDGYYSGIITSSLSNGFPVLCRGRRLESKGINKIGHAFLIDGYKRFITKTTYYYEWSTDDPTIIRYHPLVPRKTEVEYSSPHISYYCMNWGQHNTAANYTWCSLDGCWKYLSYPPYIYERKMIYNFSIRQ